MGSKSDQVKGLANQAVGKLKKGVGKMTGSTETQAKGAARRGQRQSAADDGKSQVSRQRHGQQGGRQGQQEALRLGRSELLTAAAGVATAVGAQVAHCRKVARPRGGSAPMQS